jgi:hypothetical protein
MIRENRQTDANISTLIDAQILGVVTKLKDTIYCNRTNKCQELKCPSSFKEYNQYK